MSRYITAIVFFATLISVSIAYAQPDSLWSRTFGTTGDDWALSISPSLDDGYILCGSSSAALNGQVWVIKTTASGDSVWGRAFGGNGNDIGSRAGTTNDGGYFFVGYTRSFGAGSSDMWLVKLDEDGNQAWSRTYGGSGEDNCYWGAEATDGGFILVGETMSFGNTNFDFWILKVNAQGDSMWSRTYGGPTADAGATYVSLTDDGGYIVCGVTRPAGGNDGSFWLIKLDQDGNMVWSNTYGALGDDLPWCVCQCEDGGYAVVGRRTRTNGLTDAWLLRTNAGGDSLWSAAYGGPGTVEQALSVVETWDGGYILTGQGSQANGDVLLTRTNSTGAVLWSSEFGGSNMDAGYQVLPTEDGGYAVAGGTMSFGRGGVDFWLVKTGQDPITGADEVPVLPAQFALSAYPNPFNAATTLVVDLPFSGMASLCVFDTQGRLVTRVVNGYLTAGVHRYAIEGTNLSTGSYFLRLEAGEIEQEKRIILLK